MNADSAALLPRTPSFRLDGKRALITGGGRGLGRAAAIALASAGASVTAVARSRDDVEALAASLKAEGHAAEGHALDVTDVASVNRFVAGAEPFDILVNNAGMNRPKPMVEVSEEDYDAVIDLNVRAAYFVAKAVTARLLETGRPGSIINMSSQMGHVGSPNRTLYCTSKFAVEGLTKAMAVELAPNGIRVNSIGPTFIETPMTAPMFARPEFKEFVLSKIALGRIGEVEDIMGAIVFLASDASALMTGSALVVDGGWTAA